LLKDQNAFNEPGNNKKKKKTELKEQKAFDAWFGFFN
jgi:hypothetical protein